MFNVYICQSSSSSILIDKAFKNEYYVGCNGCYLLWSCLPKGALTYDDVRCFGVIFDLPIYPNQILSDVAWPTYLHLYLTSDFEKFTSFVYYSVVSIKRTGSLNYFEVFYYPELFFHVLNEIFLPPWSRFHVIN